MPPLRSITTVSDNVPFGDSRDRGFFALSLVKPAWESFTPGQFVMLRPTTWGKELTWARPFSICRVTEQTLVLFFQVVGKGTKRLAKLKAGDPVVIWGPLGNGFTVDPKKPTLLLAGGIGIAPFAGYVDQHPAPHHLSMVFGHRMPLSCYPADTLAQRINMQTFQDTKPEDLKVLHDTITGRMEEIKKANGLALACGPMAFLKSVHSIAQKTGVPTQLSLEQRMACGVGACLGCVTPITEHFADKDSLGLPAQTCTKGPVFWAQDIAFND